MQAYKKCIVESGRVAAYLRQKPLVLQFAHLHSKCKSMYDTYCASPFCTNFTNSNIDLTRRSQLCWSLNCDCGAFFFLFFMFSD